MRRAQPRDRHYVALIEADFGKGDAETYHKMILAAMRDPACIVVVSQGDAIKLAELDFPVVSVYMHQKQISMVQMVAAYGRLEPYTYPMPWTTNLAHFREGMRSVFPADVRKEFVK